MDASTSTKTDADKTKMFNVYLKLDDIDYPVPSKQKYSVIKYTKLPDFDFDAKASWSAHSYTLKPRLRRIISIDEDDLLKTSQSLMSNPAASPKMMSTFNSRTKRKIVTISEEDENDLLHPKFSKDKKLFSVKTTSKSSEANFKNNKQSPNRLTSRLSNSTKFSKEIKTSANAISANRKEVTVAQQNNRGRTTRTAAENIKMKRDEETLRSSRNLKRTSKISVSQNLVIPRESEKEITQIKNILYSNLKSKPAAYNNPLEKPKPNKLPHLQNKLPKATLKEISNKVRPSTVIHVPLDVNHKNSDKNVSTVPDAGYLVHLGNCNRGNCNRGTDHFVHSKDAVVATDPLPTSISRITEMQDSEVNTITTCERPIQTDSKKTLFDSLEIPNVTLTKDKSEPKEDPKIFNTTLLPNLKVPPVKIVPHNEEVNSSDISFCQSSSYIISRATLTYTTRQKFNFQLVGNDDADGPSLPPSSLNYPINVMSVFKNELKKKKTNDSASSDDSYKKKNTPREEYLNHLNDLKTLNCSYVVNKLIKPSDIISTIRVNNGLLQSDYICEQFQRELNFIDSFFESLQYLETCSLTEKCYPENKVEHFSNNSVLFDSTFGVKSSEYDNFLSKLENGANIDDPETMASKSLCLLNLLIRDEQRRAKNLLFVLKMREDALKDFTKSQILWLEKKKKHDNTDISTLKKKQRGALLKLQHECGEMQRMRKALLTLSEKRKVALMKTKKNIELKLKNNVDVEQIILGKKKLKRSTCWDRNATPLKCFDLSSSGCEESSTSKVTSDASLIWAETPQCPVVSVTSAEKCVQTSDVRCVVDNTTDTAAENFVVVDGGYLNILFHNLTLPEIFSSGKQYEVNEEALRNIVNSANSHNSNLSGCKVVEKLMDQIKNKDSDKSYNTNLSGSEVVEKLMDQIKNTDSNRSYNTNLSGSEVVEKLMDQINNTDSNRSYNTNLKGSEVVEKRMDQIKNTDSNRSYNTNLSGSEVVEKLMDQINNTDSDKSYNTNIKGSEVFEKLIDQIKNTDSNRSYNTNIKGSEVVEKLMGQIKNTDSNRSYNTNLKGNEVVEKLMDQIKNIDSDRSSSSPSTARSLIEEFDQYYKDLHEGDKSQAITPELKSDNSSKVYEIKDSSVQTEEGEYEQPEEQTSQTTSAKTITGKVTCRINETLPKIGDPCDCEGAAPVETDSSLDKEPVTTSQAPTGPLPVPVGAAAVDSLPPDTPKSTPSSLSETDSVSTQSLHVSSIASLTAPVHVEAEELRRQQLAIEREIKALEQQQCRLLVVREIPDKPPPPYTPPTETRTPKPPRMFTPDENLKEKVEKHIIYPEGSVCDLTEAFSVFVKDYCLESLERHKQEQSDKPWDACNLLPQKPQVEIHELVDKTSSELKDVLTTVMPAAVSGVSSRRSDHIDDILFTEWRRCEPEWTALHTDEALVKSQIFESIFQKILTDTIDEYKKTVQCEVVASD